MPKLFGVDIAKELSTAMSPGLLTAKLIKVTVTNPVTANTTEGGLTEKSYSCKGVISDYSDLQVDGTVIQTGDRRIVLLAGSLPSNISPDTGDFIEIEGGKSTIVQVFRDPAGATYTCQTRV